MNKKKLLGLLGGVLVFSIAVVMIVIIIVLVVIPEDETTISVATKTAGTITGLIVHVKAKGARVYEFHNIKYAEPPIGALRFQPPVPLKLSPSDAVNASDATVIECIQGHTGAGTEDCLVLTVKTTNMVASKSKPLKPVLVWIHGGGLTWHSGSGKVGYHFSSSVTQKMDMVTVNINYRLAFLGFSSVEELWDADNGVYANNGIRDMVLALDWIQDNIKYFGGDPDSVTLIGNSGGATAILALACSPLANNKFHRGIAQSAAPEMRFTHEQGNTFQRFLVDALGCGTQASLEERKACLLAVEANKFSAQTLQSPQGMAYFRLPTDNTLLSPMDIVGWIMTDPTVVTVAPRDLADATFKPTKPLTLVISNTAEENFEHAPEIADTDVAQLNVGMEATLKKLTGRDGLLQDEIKPIYPGVEGKTLWSLLSCDIRATCPSNDVAEEMSKADNRDIYRLYITHKASVMPAIHTYDSLALFGYEAIPMTLQPMDYKFEDYYQNLIKGIARGAISWRKFPGESLILENTEQISKVTATKPQKDVCDKLASLDLVKYGWQNRK